MSVARFSGKTGELSAVLDGRRSSFVIDSWRVPGRFYLNDRFFIKDDWRATLNEDGIEPVYAIAVVDKLEYNTPKFGKVKVHFHIINTLKIR